MVDPVLTPVPEPHRAAVRQALLEAFPGESIAALTPLTGGQSGALVYRVDHGERRSVLRLVVNPNAFNSPARQFAAMEAAARAGIAPAVRYSNSVTGIAISAFVTTSGRTWREDFHQAPALVGRLGERVRKLHDGPDLAPFLDAFECIDGGRATLESGGVTLPPLLVTFLTRLEGVRAVLSPHLRSVPSHNDLNPGNVLIEGSRLWIIDWEAASQNDPMFDLATMIHWFGFEGDERAALLAGYFGGDATSEQVAKLELMAQVTSCYYGIVFLLLTLQAGQTLPVLDPETLPTFPEARAQLATGALAIGSAHGRTVFSLAMIRDALRRMDTPPFAAAMLTLGGASG